MSATEPVRSDIVLTDEIVSKYDLEKIMRQAEAAGVLYNTSPMSMCVYVGSEQEWSLDKTELLDLDGDYHAPFMYAVPADTRSDPTRENVEEFQAMSTQEMAEEIAYWMIDAESTDVQDEHGNRYDTGIENIALIVVDYETTCLAGFIPLVRALLAEQRRVGVADVVVYVRRSGRFHLWQEAPMSIRRIGVAADT